jgi:hypothetical protein
VDAAFASRSCLAENRKSGAHTRRTSLALRDVASTSNRSPDRYDSPAIEASAVGSRRNMSNVGY